MEIHHNQAFSSHFKSPIETLRFITCGSVDDGKSTLIGRLFYDSGNIYEDQISALKTDSHLYGTQKDRLDYALLVDGLQSERQQGITIDVAYRYFHTGKRRYIVADTPGHEQYTRNMATAASTADVAVILVDARKGVLRQTLRHSRIVATMNCRHVVLAINKMDLIGFDQLTFDTLVKDYLAATKSLNFDSIYPLPLCSLDGDNILTPSPRTPWFHGKPLLAYLDSLSLSQKDLSVPFRMPVQYINRPHLDFRGYSGRVASGTLQAGDQVKVLPSGVTTRVRRVILGFDDVETVQAGDSVTVTFTDEIDASRGCVLVSPEDPPPVADQFQVTLIWMDQEPLHVGRPYILKIGTKETVGTISKINSIENIGADGDRTSRPQSGTPPERLQLNEIAQVTIKTDSPVVVEPFRKSRSLGGFILIDKMTYATVAAGMTQQVLSSPEGRDIHWHHLTINQKSRGEAKHQTPRCLWFTGLSGSGKSTIANLLEKRLFADHKHTYILDGDNLRYGINGDLGFSDADRTENVRRVAQVAKLMVDAGLIVLVSLIAPFRSDRQRARDLFGAKEFIEIYIETPLHICEERDPKGLYAKARRGALKNFTGIGSPYEPPLKPELAIDTRDQSPEECVDKILRHLRTL